MSSITKANRRHLKNFFVREPNAAAPVYESIGPDFFLSPAPGWLNLGLWTGEGDASEAEASVVRLVENLAGHLPPAGTILDAGNGLGAGEPVIARVARPRRLVALNITEAQLYWGRERLAEARALAVAGDATRIPLATGSVDGIISVEAAFHFPSRAAFFAESRRVLRPGGVLTMSDVAAERTRPRTPGELVSGLTNMRVWGVRRSALQSTSEITDELVRAGFESIEVEAVGERVLGPAIRFMRARLETSIDAPLFHRLAARTLLAQWDLLYRRGMMEYLLISATSRGR